MKKVLTFALLAFSFSASGAVSTDSGTEASGFTSMFDGDLSVENMRQYVAPEKGAHAVFDAYIENGYLPLDAMMLANWDLTEVLRELNPEVPDDQGLRKRIDELRATYKPAN